MKGFDKLSIKSAVKDRNKFDLSRSHLTTAQFGQILPLFYEETVPGDKFTIEANFFSRLAPLAKPTYGKFSFKTASFFVPYFQVADDIEAWLAGLQTWEGTTCDSRWITFTDLINFLIDSTIATSTSSSDYDFAIKNAGGTRVTYEFTNYGKYVIKVLNSLGYSIPQNADFSINGTWISTIGSTKMSALPLLAFFKAYNDWMAQSQRYNSSLLSSIINGIRFNKNTVTGYNNSTRVIGAACLKNMFSMLKLCYENDYFISAWERPNGPIAQTNGPSSIDVPGNLIAGISVFDSLTNDAQKVELVPGNTNIVQRSLDYLKAFDDWVRRNNYSGSRAVQQIYSRFGIKTDDYRSNYAHLLDTDSTPIQVGDVTSTSETTGASLGDYAGKGIMNSNKRLHVEVSDYGCVFVFGYFTVRPMMSYGSDRAVLRNSPMDYYTPEFDGLGADAISYAEIFQNPLSPATDTYQDNAVYGFTERYNSYRFGRDKITGEFRNYTNYDDMNTWHSGRLLEDIRSTGNLIAQNPNVTVLSPIDSEYNRIFSVTTGDEDKFYLTAQFSVDAVRPMKSLNQVPRLGEGNTQVERNGNVVS